MHQSNYAANQQPRSVPDIPATLNSWQTGIHRDIAFQYGWPKARIGKSWLALVTALLGLGSASALAEPAPKSLDQALTSTLALGGPDGCSSAFGIRGVDAANGFSQSDHDHALTALRDNKQLGNELTAICGSSAVASAAALGGSLGSLQTTKTVSQFHLVRRRVDSRLGLRGEGFGLDGSLLLAELDAPYRTTLTDVSGPDLAPQSRFAVFTQIDYERRNRVTTPLEGGYKANISGGLIGVDYMTPSDILVGAWLGYGNTNADYRSVSPLISNGTPPNLTPALLADICNIGPGGGFDNKDLKLGGFAGTRIGSGFADVALQYNRRHSDYHRNTCAIEIKSTDEAITPDPLSYSGWRNGGQVLDDIYAGTISGRTRLTEWSLSTRAGYDFGDDRLLWGPRLSITYQKSMIDAFTETGQTSVTNEVRSNTPVTAGDPLGLTTTRAPGRPTGLELTYDKQDRSSLQSNLQLVAAYRFDTAYGPFIPRASASWIHEFRGKRQLVNVHMAQDHRASPTQFSFTTDSVDKDKGVIALGVTALINAQIVADFEVAHLVADRQFHSTTLTAQVRWKF